MNLTSTSNEHLQAKKPDYHRYIHSLQTSSELSLVANQATMVSNAFPAKSADNDKSLKLYAGH